MIMGVKVYYSEISGNKEVKKRQQRVMMILESKTIPYDAIDITEPGKESEKEFMFKNAKTRGDCKYVQSPQIFNDEVYCGDYDDFDMANENDVLEEFLHCPKKVTNGVKSREGSAEQSKNEPTPPPQPHPVEIPSVETPAEDEEPEEQIAEQKMPDEDEEEEEEEQ